MLEEQSNSLPLLSLPPLHAHGLGAAADWTWRGKLDLVCDGPGVFVVAVSGFTMKWLLRLLPTLPPLVRVVPL